MLKPPFRRCLRSAVAACFLSFAIRCCYFLFTYYHLFMLFSHPKIHTLTTLNSLRCATFGSDFNTQEGHN